MEKKQRVVFYGNTLILAGIDAAMGLDPDCEVVAHAFHGSQQELSSLEPDVLIFDLEQAETEFLLAQLQAQPGLLIIGVDPESHDVLLTGQAASRISLDQITKIVRSRDRP